MTATATTPQQDSFVSVSLSAWLGLTDAVRELGWIADGGDPSASFADRDLANLKRLEYKDKIDIIESRLTAYMAKKLTVDPPSSAQADQASRIASDLAQWRTVNVTTNAIIAAATDLLNLYNNAV